MCTNERISCCFPENRLCEMPLSGVDKSVFDRHCSPQFLRSLTPSQAMLSRSARALAHRRPLSLASTRVAVRPFSTTPVSSLQSSRQLGASPSGSDGFASSTNSFYIDSMYEEYKKVRLSFLASFHLVSPRCHPELSLCPSFSILFRADFDLSGTNNRILLQFTLHGQPTSRGWTAE
jgi:hypothetical protein